MPDKITRRDILNGTLLASGAAALSAPAPASLYEQATGAEWDGFGGVGDYRTAHGNTWNVVRDAHRIRSGEFEIKSCLASHDTGEKYDLSVVGGGSAGLGAAYCFQKLKPRTAEKCLILENHSLFGGEEKQNEFLVSGVMLIGPQGPWRLIPVPSQATGWMRELYRDIKLDGAEFRYQAWDPSLGDRQFDRGQDFSLLLPPKVASFGYFFSEKTGGKPSWLRDLWRGNLGMTPLSTEARRDLEDSVFGKHKTGSGSWTFHKHARAMARHDDIPAIPADAYAVRRPMGGAVRGSNVRLHLRPGSGLRLCSASVSSALSRIQWPYAADG